MPSFNTKSSDQFLDIKELDQEEYSKLLSVPPWNLAKELPNFDNVKVIAAIHKTTGEIVGYWFVATTVHVEPLWISDGYRGLPGLIRSLWRQVHEVLVRYNIPVSFAVIADKAAADNVPMAMRMGFKEVPAKLFYYITNPEEQTVGQRMLNSLGIEDDEDVATEEEKEVVNE